MNTNYNNKSSTSTHQKSSFNSFDFDLGLGCNKPRSLNDQKAPLSSEPKPSPSPSWLPNNNKPSPSWTHQPSLSGGPTSLVGDISGKSWGASGSTSQIGIVSKDPSLFGDLVGSVLGQNKGSSSSSANVPLKNATPASSKNAYSMGGLGDSLPAGGSVGKAGGGWGSSESFGSFASAQSSKSFGSGNGSKGLGLGGPSMKNMAGGGMSSVKDPFGNLVNFGLKQSGSKAADSGGVGNAGSDVFGVFQNASNLGTSAFISGAGDGSLNKSASSAMDDFGAFASGGTGLNNAGFMGSNESYSSSSRVDDFGGFASTATGFSNSSFIGSNKSSKSAINDFGMPPMNSVPLNQSSGVDPLDKLFSSPSASATSTAAGSGGQQTTGLDDWGLDTDFGGDGGHDVGGTTELEGRPPPPAGVSASTAMNKGMDNHKQGQYPDAIKWFSWAIVLFEKAGDAAATKDVLSSRASCYKEVGEYKKAVADCTKVLEKDDKNVSVLVQRALLYESMEKYKLGAEDLRTVLKIDPLNRIARSTIHRLTKMAD